MLALPLTLVHEAMNALPSVMVDLVLVDFALSSAGHVEVVADPDGGRQGECVFKRHVIAILLQ